MRELISRDLADAAVAGLSADRTRRERQGRLGEGGLGPVRNRNFIFEEASCNESVFCCSF